MQIEYGNNRSVSRPAFMLTGKSVRSAVTVAAKMFILALALFGLSRLSDLLLMNRDARPQISQASAHIPEGVGPQLEFEYFSAQFSNAGVEPEQMIDQF